MNWLAEHKTWVASVGACIVATGLLWFGKLSDAIWWALVSSTLIPLITKEGFVQVKAMKMTGEAPKP